MSLVFHGSRNKFLRFDPAYQQSDEAARDFTGFYFVDNPYGAKWHCESPLRCTGNEGYIYVCEIPERFLRREIQCSGCHYRGDTFGVRSTDINLLTILEVIPLAKIERFLSTYNHIQIY